MAILFNGVRLLSQTVKYLVFHQTNISKQSVHLGMIHRQGSYKIKLNILQLISCFPSFTIKIQFRNVHLKIHGLLDK